jgi:hypothetical protein
MVSAPGGGCSSLFLVLIVGCLAFEHALIAIAYGIFTKPKNTSRAGGYLRLRGTRLWAVAHEVSGDGTASVDGDVAADNRAYWFIADKSFRNRRRCPSRIWKAGESAGAQFRVTCVGLLN